MSEIEEHRFCECDEFVHEYRGQLSNEMRPYYLKSEVDAVLAEKDAEIRKLRRALYKACANWADVVAFEETEGIGYDNSVAERWRKMESKCREKAERYK